MAGDQAEFHMGALVTQFPQKIHYTTHKWVLNVLPLDCFQAWHLSETGHCVRSHSSWTPPKCSNLCAKYQTKAARKRTIRKCIASDGTDHICWMMLRVVLKWYLWMWLVMSPVPVQWIMTGHWVLSVMSCWYMWLSTLSHSDVNSVWIKVSIFCWRYKHGCYGYRYI